MSIPALEQTSAEIAPANELLRGAYRNEEYGFSFIIPSGYSGESSPSPAPQHGIKINLSRDKANYIWFDGSYNAESYRLLSQPSAAHVARIKSEGNAVITKLQHKSRLGSLSAELTEVKYKNLESKQVRTDSYIVALRDADNEMKDTGIIYSAGINCDQQHYEEAKAIFNQVVASWSLLRAHANIDAQ